MFVNFRKDQSNMTVLSLETESISQRFRALINRPPTLNLFLFLRVFISMQCLLDPSVCTTSADCSGGVCQLGVCIGDIQEQDQDVTNAEKLPMKTLI